LALAQSSGHCQIRLFGANSSSVDFPSGGQLAGWGLRNSVGVAEHPKSGGIWSVENSVDNLHRLGSDIHNDNPGEELNYHGTVSQLRGANHGYPVCYALWGTDGVPSLGNLTTGNQFAVDAAEDQAVASAETDASCNADFAQPEITFQAHTAPLDIKFDANGTTAYISFHGSCESERTVCSLLSVSLSDTQGIGTLR
jgi:glucose/arabinose dehydrogenase